MALARLTGVERIREGTASETPGAGLRTWTFLPSSREREGEDLSQLQTGFTVYRGRKKWWPRGPWTGGNRSLLYQLCKQTCSSVTALPQLG